MASRTLTSDLSQHVTNPRSSKVPIIRKYSLTNRSVNVGTAPFCYFRHHTKIANTTLRDSTLPIIRLSQLAVLKGSRIINSIRF